MVRNCLTVDVEEWFHICGVEALAGPDRWNELPSRVVANTRQLLELLDRQTALFLSDPRNVKFDPAKHTLQVTKLFSWFLLDFTPPGFFKGRRTPPSDDDIVAAYLEQSGPKELKAQLAAVHNRKEIKVTFSPFDWSLNDADATH